jgi:hypothetical protein
MSEPPRVTRPSRKRGLAIALGTLLIALALWLIRASPALRAREESIPLVRLLLANPGEHDFILRRMSASFPAGLCVLVVGAFILGWAIPRPIPRQPEGGPRVRSPEGRVDFVLLAVAPVVSLGLFGAFSSQRLMEKPAVIIPFGIVFAFTVATATLLARKRGVRIGASLSRREAVALAFGTLAVLALLAHGLNSWKYSFVGDEWAFHTAALQMREWGLTRIPWLSARGVYDQWPLALSAWQGLWIGFVPAASNVGWRFANAVLMASCFVPLYLTLRHLLGRVTPSPRAAAAFGATCFCLSEFIAVWGRMGKPHASFVPPLVFAGALHFAARARRSNVHYFLSGIACGLGLLLSSLGGAVPLAIFSGMLLLEALMSRPRERSIRHDVILPFAFVFSGFVLAAAPNLVQLDYWEGLVKLNLASKEARQSRHLVLAKTVQSAFSFVDYDAHGGFLCKNTIDPITAFLACAGLAMPRLLGRRTWAVLVFALVGVAFLAGGISQYSYPPTTRMMLIMYPVALLAASGLAGLTSVNPKRAVAAAGILATVVAAYNLLKLECWNPYKNREEIPLHEIRRIQDSSPSTLHVLVLPEHERGFLIEMSQAYGLADRIVTFEDEASTYGALSDLLTESRGGDIEVRVLETSPNVEEVRVRAQTAGARFGPLISAGIPPLSGGFDARVFPFFEALNP